MSILTIRQRGDWLVAGFNVDSLTDASTLGQATRELATAFETLPLRGQAAISFEGVQRASSQLAPMLRAAAAIVRDERFGRLVLCRIEPNLAQLMRITRLDDQFEIFARLRDVLVESKNRSFAGMSMSTANAASPRTSPSETEWID